jgi:hypothetical protein
VQALRGSEADTLDALRGAGYGVVQGANEMQEDPGEAAVKAVEAAAEVARLEGLPEEVAKAETAQGAMQAAEALGPAAVAQVAASLSEEGLADYVTKPTTDDGRAGQDP